MQRPRPATSRAHLFVPSRQPIGIVAVHGHDSGPLRLDGACGLTAAKVRSNKVFHPATSGVPLPEGDPLAGTGAASGGTARPQVPTSLRVVNPVPPGRPTHRHARDPQLPLTPRPAPPLRFARPDEGILQPCRRGSRMSRQPRSSAAISAMRSAGEGSGVLAGQRSTSVWFTLDHGTSSRRIPFSDAFVLDVVQHQSNAFVGIQVNRSPAH